MDLDISNYNLEELVEIINLQDIPLNKGKINERIDDLHEKTNTKISRAELSGWVVAVSALVVLVQSVM